MSKKRIFIITVSIVYFSQTQPLSAESEFIALFNYQSKDNIWNYVSDGFSDNMKTVDRIT